MSRPKDQKRADYILYSWQIRAIQGLAQKRQQGPSEVMRDLLNRALIRTQETENPSERSISIS